MASTSEVSCAFHRALRASAVTAAAALGFFLAGPVQASAASALTDGELDQVTAGAIDLATLLRSDSLDLNTLLSALSDLSAFKAVDPSNPGNVDFCVSASNCTSTSSSVSTSEPGSAVTTLSLPEDVVSKLGEPASSLSSSFSTSPGTSQITIPASVLQSLMGLSL